MVAMKAAMRLRHRLVPYIFSQNAAQSQLTLVQPLYWRYPQRSEAYEYPNEYFFGQSLVVAPVVTPRHKSTNRARTRAWLPPSRHVDIFTGIICDGDRDICLYCKLDHIPVFTPEGSIVPLDQNLLPANGCANPAGFEVIIIVGHDGTFEILEDTRDDVEIEQGAVHPPFRSITISFDKAAGRLTTTSAGRGWKFRFLAANINPSNIQVRIHDRILSEPRCWSDNLLGRHSILVEVPSENNPMGEIAVDIGPAPQLAILDHTCALQDIIRDFQIDFLVKDKIWAIVETEQPTTVKASRLISMDLDELFYGPIAELLLADTRT